MNLAEFHSKFPGGARWRVTASGVEVEGKGLEPLPVPYLRRGRDLAAKYKEKYAAAAEEFQIPVELLVACSLTEAAPINPETSVREEPGFVSDDKTPNRISAGFCQLLISTARGVMRNPGIDRQWLLDVGNSLRACAAYIKQQSAMTFLDPVLVACAYNAGGLYLNDSPMNRWRLRQYPIGNSNHADRFVINFNAAMQQTNEGVFAGRSCPQYVAMLLPKSTSG